ncbi:MAG: DHA2 family efflux MFS transporter permease subunit [Armatimonadetes bacterium]|nr:DHA2 family efflux MFS transporter permease subunit [Armatimonadota bacterium]
MRKADHPRNPQREAEIHKWMIAIAASLSAILEVIDTSIVNVALTDMQSTLGATLSEIGWVITSYAIATVIMIPLSAWLGNYFGRKRYFVFCIIGFTVFSVMCGLSRTLPMLILSRVLQGLAGGGLLAKAQSILFETFPKEEHGKAQGIFGIGVIAGPAIGPTLGGWITTNYSWPWIFFINVPFGIAATWMMLAHLPADSKIRSISDKVDWAGIGLLIVSLGSIQWLLEEGQAEGWFESRLIVTLALTGLVSLILFIWRELKTKHPAVDLHVLRHRSVAAGSIFSAVLGMGLFGAIFAIPIFAQTVLQMTPQQTGMLLLPGALASAVMMPIMGKVASKYDARILIAMGAAVVVSSMFMLGSMTTQTGEDQLFAPLLIRGVGTVMMFLPLSLSTLGPVPKKDLPAASGFYNLTRQLGGSIGIAVLTTLLAQRHELHRSHLVENISLYNPIAVDRLQTLSQLFIARGFDPVRAQSQALALIDRTISIQATVMSFGDIFRVVGIAFLASLPLLFLMGRGRGGGKASMDH